MRCSLFAFVALVAACAAPSRDAAVECHVGTAGLAVEVVHLEHAGAVEVAAVLRQLLNAKADGRRSVTCALYPPGRRPMGTRSTWIVAVDLTSNSVVLHGEPEDVRAMREIVTKLDGQADRP